MKSSLSMLVLLSSLSVATGFLVIRFGQCPITPIKENFDATKYLGIWWEYQRFPAPFEFASTCGYANYTVIDSKTIRVINTGIQDIDLFFYHHREKIEAVGEAVIMEPGKLRVSFGGMPAGDEKANYFVVDTDYENYAVVFSCSGSFINVQFAWILTRKQGLKPSNLEQIHNTLRESGVDVSPFITVSHKDCSKPTTD